MSRMFKWTAALVALAAVGIGLALYWRHSSLHPSTDDAYIQADVVRIAPRVGGRVIQVPVVHYQHVHKGDLLVQIDPEPFQVALAQAQAQLANVSQQVGGLESGVAAARAAIVQSKAQLENARINAGRIEILVRRGVAAQAQLDDARAQLRTAQGAYAADQARLEQAHRELGQAGRSNAQVQAALAQVEMARLNLSYARIESPADGVLGEVNIRPGAMAQAGEALFPMVEDGSFWVEANFKETDLKRIRPGQPATMGIDISDTEYHGVVVGISPASGVAFSLLPPENATGNWVKVTQRFPIRIAPTDADKVPVPWSPWRVGASVNVAVDTTRLSNARVSYPPGSEPGSGKPAQGPNAEPNPAPSDNAPVADILPEPAHAAEPAAAAR